MMMAVGTHLFPFRTEKLNLPAPKILAFAGKIGRRRGFVVLIKVNLMTVARDSADLYRL